MKRKIEKINGDFKSKHPLYATWSKMKSRCNNKRGKDYFYYGARGVKVCSRWNKSFLLFLKDMGEKPTKQHSLDRVNNNGNYSPRNCRWATVQQQVENARPFFQCKNGHKWTPETTRYGKTKKSGNKIRMCKICYKEYDRGRYLMKKAQGIYSRTKVGIK